MSKFKFDLNKSIKSIILIMINRYVQNFEGVIQEGLEFGNFSMAESVCDKGFRYLSTISGSEMDQPQALGKPFPTSNLEQL